MSAARHPKTVTRTVILSQALEMTGRHLPRLSSVLDELGRTTGFAYQVWPNQKAFWEDLTARIAVTPWVTAGRVDERIVRIALRHCDHRDLTPRFGELVAMADKHDGVTAETLLWMALAWRAGTGPDV